MNDFTRSPETAPVDTGPLLLTSELKWLAEVRKWVQKVGRQSGLSQEALSDLLMAVGEAFTNCVKHAYGMEPDGRIQLSSSVTDHHIGIHIRDWGTSFPVFDYTEPDLSEAHEGGYGIFLMKQLTDRLEIDVSDPPGTSFSLYKTLGGN